MSDWIQELLDAAENASDVPHVYSEPLARLQMALAKHEDAIAELEPENPLWALINNMTDVAEGWSFYPADAYGSNLAIVSADSVIEMIDALHKYRDTQEKAA